MEFLHLQQSAHALGGAGLLCQIIALEQLLVLGLQQRITRRRLGEDEECHPGNVSSLSCDGMTVVLEMAACGGCCAAVAGSAMRSRNLEEARQRKEKASSAQFRAKL